MTENNFQIDSAAVTDKGLSEKRPQNEDSYLEMNECGLFVVADGVGGAQAGDVASQMAVEILSEAFANLQKNGDAEDTMRIAIERANQSIFKTSHDLPQLSTMATTIVALHISGNIATIGHVGDSRLYRLDAKGNLYRETQDHSVVEEELRAGRLTAAQAANHPSRNVISRALGSDNDVEVDMKTIMFEPQATFLLCSDGITRHIEDAELRQILLSEENPSNAVRRMKEICYQRGAEDNLTAVIAKVTDKVLDKSVKNTKGKSFADYEESTVATARAPLSGNATSTNALIVEDKSNALIIEDDSPTQPLEMPVAETVQKQETIVEPVYTQHSAVKTAVSTAPVLEKTNSPSGVVIVPNNEVQTVAAQKSEIVIDKKTPRVVEKSGSGAFGRFLASLLLLALGGILGAGAYYYWSQNRRPAVVESEVARPLPEAAPAVSYSAFESSRRSVDKNPQAYVDSNVLPPQKAEDFYLQGRAYLLTGKYPEAKKSFEEAKNRLAQVDEANSKIIANEIAMSLAIINDPFAQKAFEKDVAADNPNASAQTNANFGTNSADTNANATNATQNLDNR